MAHPNTVVVITVIKYWEVLWNLKNNVS